MVGAIYVLLIYALLFYALLIDALLIYALLIDALLIFVVSALLTSAVWVLLASSLLWALSCICRVVDQVRWRVRCLGLL